MPDTYTVFVNITNPVQRDTVVDTVVIHKLKKEVIVGIKINSIKWQANDSLLKTIKVAEFKYASGKFSIPVNAINEFLNGLHDTSRSQCQRGNR